MCRTEVPFGPARCRPFGTEDALGHLVVPGESKPVQRADHAARAALQHVRIIDPGPLPRFMVQ